MYIGIDLGGTKIELIVLNEQGREIFKTRENTPKQYQETVNILVSMVNEADEYVGIKCSVGMGLPGCISLTTENTKHINNFTLPWLNGEQLNKDLNHILSRNVIMANDANCFAVSEATDGAARGLSVVFGVILGTGCGSGIAINATAHAGRNAIAGEWGHNPLPWLTKDEFNTTVCVCGQSDCIETFISGTGFVRDFNLGEIQVKRAEEIIVLMERNEKQAIQAFDRLIDRLARSLAQIINVIDPDAIVLGGGLSNIDMIYQHLPERLHRYVFGHECKTPILKNTFGCSSGVRGAAWLAK